MVEKIKNNVRTTISLNPKKTTKTNKNTTSQKSYLIALFNNI